jgi:glucosylceramidase
MPPESTRRDFLKLSAMGATAVATAHAFPGLTHTRGAKPSMIATRVTHGKERFAQGSALEWRRGTPGGEAIVLDPQKKFQEILGFGAAFTDAACYNFNQLSSSAREQLFHELFHPSELGLNVGRTCIGSSDYSTKVYSFDDGEPDPELKRFSIEHDRAYILPILRQARAVNPDLFLFSSPWSPPGWMKTGGSMLGGSMRKSYYGSYAQYFVKFLDAYKAEGVPIQAITVQNEVDTDQDGRMPACLWGQEYEIEFVRDHLGPLLEANKIDTKIWILDHNYNLWGRVMDELEDPGVRKYANAVAWHGYGGAAEMVAKVHDAYPNVGMHWTEGGPDYTSPDYATDWTRWGGIFTAALRNWCQSIAGWNLALVEKGRPNIGPFLCGGMVTIHSQSREITRSGQYWAITHFARCIRRGARRFESTGTLHDLEHLACENPDGQKVLIVTNSGPSRTITLQMGSWITNLSCETDSVSTLLWN